MHEGENMGFFSRFRKEKKTVSNSISANRLFSWGNSKVGAKVNEQTALQTAAVYACVRVIAESVASLPLKVYVYDDDDRSGSKVVTKHHLYKLLYNAPNPEMTSFAFREAMMTQLLIHGNAFAQIIRDGAGRVTALYPLLSNKMDVRRNESGQIYYTYWRDFDDPNIQRETGAIILRKDQVLHIPGLSFNGLVGLSPLALARETIGLTIAAEEFGSAFFGNGATPSGVLEVPGETKAENLVGLRDAWDAIHKGANNSHNIAILTDGAKYHQISIPPEQAQFLETRKFQLNEIARIFRVPPHMIGDLERSTYSNVEQQSLEFVKYCLNPWITRWEQAMWQCLILLSEQDTHYVKFNLDGLMRGDYETRMRGYSIGIQNGFMCPNDIRRLENMNEIPEEEGGFNYMVNGNMVKLKDVGAAYRARRGLDGSEDKE